jgi:hypothetical protein
VTCLSVMLRESFTAPDQPGRDRAIGRGGLTHGRPARHENAMIVPIQSLNVPLYASRRVKQADASTAILSPLYHDPGITNVWLSNC